MLSRLFLYYQEKEKDLKSHHYFAIRPLKFKRKQSRFKSKKMSTGRRMIFDINFTFFNNIFGRKKIMIARMSYMLSLRSNAHFYWVSTKKINWFTMNIYEEKRRIFNGGGERNSVAIPR